VNGDYFPRAHPTFEVRAKIRWNRAIASSFIGQWEQYLELENGIGCFFVAPENATFRMVMGIIGKLVRHIRDAISHWLMYLIIRKVVMGSMQQMTSQAKCQTPVGRISQKKRQFQIGLSFAAVFASLVGASCHALGQVGSSMKAPSAARKVKAMIVTMFDGESKTWLDRQGPWETIKVPGLAPKYPVVHCNRQEVCVITTDMGHANAAASIMALAFSNQFDLSKTYFLVAGIGGIDPMQGTLGSTAWARFLVEFGAQWEVDGRERPAEWQSGFIGEGSTAPDSLPTITNHTEVFELNAELVNAGFTLSRDVALADNPEAKASRAKFAYAPANQPPSVIECDTLSDDTWWAGKLIGERARTWTKILTQGKGTYCTSQQEDNATFEALTRAASVGRVDRKRIAVLRSGSDFDRQYEGQTAMESLFSFQSAGGFAPAIENLYRAGLPLITNIVEHWPEWEGGVPSDLHQTGNAR